MKVKLIKGYTRAKGRNNQGKITNFNKGGGSKKNYRLIDFKYNFDKGIIKNIEYDPNRNTKIFKLFIPTQNIYKYIIAIENLKINDIIENDTNMNIGNIFLLKNIPIGSIISNVEFFPNQGSKLSRSSGTFCQLIKKTLKYAIIKLPSQQCRVFPLNCKAILGKVYNFKKNSKFKNKAGYSRWLGKRPKVRGVAMNPVDHPHGGGEGKTSGGRPSVNKKGIYTKGVKTRKKKNVTFKI